jgi:hypothetical protein
MFEERWWHPSLCPPGLRTDLTCVQAQLHAAACDQLTRRVNHPKSGRPFSQKQSMLRHKERMDCFASRAMTWRERSHDASQYSKRYRCFKRQAAAHQALAHADTTIVIARAQPPLSSQVEQLRAAHRRTAVEIATCPRQCADALRSNFCRHTNRMVNPQVNVLTSAGRRLQTAL